MKQRTSYSLAVQFLPFFSLIVLSLLISACSSVKPYQRAYLNDSEMNGGTATAAGIENYVQTIREGSSGGEGEKGSGGCGCN
ncbi:MAG: DUF4266 domain-containing protein [Ignavibacteriae bacterium]|nr:DUF4266 domain-containing protein [Ignavibacteriota bacterium]MCB9215788.1 DUF4266 domain-containing protein [Ignavibacteria bacterium]